MLWSLSQYGRLSKLEATPLENGIKYESSGVEELKDKTNGNTVNQVTERT